MHNQGQLLHLTPKEYSLLDLLLRQQGRLVSRETIIDRLWSFDDPPSEETVKVHQSVDQKRNLTREAFKNT